MQFKGLIKLIRLRISKTSKDNHEASKKTLSQLSVCAQEPIAETFHRLQASEKGLNDDEAIRRVKTYGVNQITHEKPQPWHILLLKNFKNPFVLLVMFIGSVSFFLEQYDSVIIISCMVIISVLMRFIQEYRSNKAAEKLKALVSTKATVLRCSSSGVEPKSQDIDIKYLVPGDIIHLSAGDIVPADVRLLTAKEVYVSQSALTGESFPVEKEESLKPNQNTNNLLEISNLCFMGTNLLNGSATAIVLYTGNATYFGAMSSSIAGYRTLTSFDLGINKVTWLLIRFIFIMVPCVFVINVFTKGNWLEAFLFSLAVAIGITPEMLPMVVTANLARGAVKMAQSKVVVKQLNSIQNFGAMDVLCTDKTGTLTQNRIILEKHLDAEGNDCSEVLLYGYLNSFYQTGLKNLLDLAVLDHSEIEAEIKKNKEFRKIDEVPFDFKRRRMSVVIQNTPEIQLLICKGAVEEMLSVCSHVKIKGSIVPVDATILSALDTIKTDLSNDGLRVLAVSYKEFPTVEHKEYHSLDEQNLIFFGFLAFLDPPKLSAEQAITSLNSYGVQVKVLTGDNELVTERICKWVDLKSQGTLLGEQVDTLSDRELQLAVEKATIFAKLTPLQKSRIILSLKANGHIVGFLGDGINDAPALREADIGISVDTAVDLAKESADIIMLEKSLLFLKDGVVEGRKTFGNIIKYIKMTLSSNFGNVFSILGASILFPFLPMLPVQILLQNLLYDLSQTFVTFDHVDQEFLLKPRKWEPKGIAQFMFAIGPVSSIFDYVLFAVMWYFYAANSLDRQSLFQSGWFIEGLLSQTLIVHMIRTRKIPFIQSTASLPLLMATIVMVLIGIYIPYSPIGASLGFTPLPGSYFYWLIAILLCYCILTQFVKMWFIRIFRFWL